MTNEDYNILERTDYCNAPSLFILHSKTRKRCATHGTIIRRSEHFNVDCGFVVQEIEMSCPDYELTDRGPVYKREDDETRS